VKQGCITPGNIRSTATAPQSWLVCSGRWRWLPALALAFVPVMTLSSLTHAADAGAGKTLYERNCQACHGASGGGDGPAARSLRPRPTKLNTAAYWAGTTNEAVKSAIREGRPGTSMMAFATLSPKQLDDVVAHLRTLSPTP
jgi:mono/diheme cytochrome c family protein